MAETTSGICLLCDALLDSHPTRIGDGYDYDCKCCGRYRVSGSAIPLFQETNPPKWKLASWVFGQKTAGIKPTLTRDFVQNAAAIRIPPLEQRAIAFLGAFYNHS